MWEGGFVERGRAYDADIGGECRGGGGCREDFDRGVRGAG